MTVAGFGKRRMTLLGLALLVLLTAGIGVAAAKESNAEFWSTGNGGPRVALLEFDVAEDMTRFAFDPDLAFEDDGYPAHGSSFVTQGYIYPKDTLSGGNGVNPDGTPEFPDQIIGTWLCYGTFIGDAAHATSGAWVATTQIYDFGDELGSQTVVTDGYELADVGVPIKRAITGGTGEYANARGEGQQIFLGLNASEGVNISFELEVKMR